MHSTAGTVETEDERGERMLLPIGIALLQRRGGWCCRRAVVLYARCGAPLKLTRRETRGWGGACRD